MYTQKDFEIIINSIISNIPYAVSIILFGSYAKGTAREDSDMDYDIPSIEEAKEAFTLEMKTKKYILKYLNKIVDLKDIIRKSGVQKVEFLNEGLLFIWPIFYLSKTRPEILNSITHGIMFSRNEIEKHESILVPYDFCWATLSGVCWSGNLKSLFSTIELFQNVEEAFEEKSIEKHRYCLDHIEVLLKSKKYQSG